MSADAWMYISLSIFVLAFVLSVVQQPRPVRRQPASVVDTISRNERVIRDVLNKRPVVKRDPRALWRNDRWKGP